MFSVLFVKQTAITTKQTAFRKMNNAHNVHCCILRNHCCHGNTTMFSFLLLLAWMYLSTIWKCSVLHWKC